MIGERLDKLRARERIGLALSGLAILGVICDQFILRPYQKRTGELLTATAEVQTRLVEAEGMAAALPVVETEYQQVAGILGESVPKSQAIDQMKSDIDGLAREARVTIVSMKHQEPRALPDYTEVLVEIPEFEAEMDGVLKFLNLLCHSGRPYTVKRLTLAPRPQQGTDQPAGLVKGALQISRIMKPMTEGSAGR